MDLKSAYLKRACSERSRPKPDCLNPPNGMGDHGAKSGRRVERITRQESFGCLDQLAEEGVANAFIDQEVPLTMPGAGVLTMSQHYFQDHVARRT
ncbi:hypothetical protein [Methyloligella solikamskensis]